MTLTNLKGAVIIPGRGRENRSAPSHSWQLQRIYSNLGLVVSKLKLARGVKEIT